MDNDNYRERTIAGTQLDTGHRFTDRYDKLVLAPGAVPLRPALAGIDDPRLFTLRSLQDMDRIKTAAATAQRAVVIGAALSLFLGSAGAFVSIASGGLPITNNISTPGALFLLFALGVGVLWAYLWKSGVLRRIRTAGPADQAPLMQAVLLLGFLTARSLFESTAAFYGVDLILFVPAVAFLYQWAADHPEPGP